MLEDGAFLALLWMFLCVIIIVGLAYWFTKYVVGRGLPAGGFMAGKQQELKALAQLMLGRDQKLVLVQAGERFLLLGVTASQISLLAELTQEEAAAWREKAENMASPPSFGEALRSALKRKG